MNFKTVWDDYSRQIEAGFVFDISTLASLFQKFSICDSEITLETIGNGKPIGCFKITCGLGVALFPIYTVNMKEFSVWNSRFSSIKSRWECIDWFIPPYIGNGRINSILSRTFSFCDVSKERALDEFEYALPSLYTISDMCAFVEQVAGVFFLVM